MVVKFRARVNGLMSVRKFGNQFGRWTQSEIPRLTEAFAKKGKEKAVQIAPKQSHELVNAIKVREDRGNTSYSIVSRVPKNQRNGRQVPYQVYIQEGKRGNYQGTKKTGDHNYMESTFEYLYPKYFDRVEKSLDKFLNKK